MSDVVNGLREDRVRDLPALDRISDYVVHWSERTPDREALVDDTTRWTYRRLREEVDRHAATLLRLGVRRGDRVALLGSPRARCFAHFLGTVSIGAVWVGLNPKYTVEELAGLVSDAGPVVLVVMTGAPDDALRAVLGRLADRTTHAMQILAEGEEIPGIASSWDEAMSEDVDGDALAVARAEVGPRDPAAMIYTSGSTGRAKGALVPHGGLGRCGRVQASHWYGREPRKLCDLPLNHIGGLGDICTSILVAGGTVVFMPRFDPGGALRMVERERITHLYYIPTQLISAVATPEWSACDLSSLEWILWGGAAAPLSLLEKLAATGAQLGTSYSLTESTGSITYTDPDDPLEVLSWSVGRVDPRYELEIRRADGCRAAVGEAGEIVLRGEHITLGYFGRPRETTEAIDDLGWLHTGDVGQLESNGHVRLVGRKKDMYKSGGYNVYPREVELAIEEHPRVSAVAVVGIPDEYWGEVGHAFVVATGLSAAELEGFLRERLANYKLPKRMWIEESLPKLPVGKVDKKTLRLRAIERTC